MVILEFKAWSGKNIVEFYNKTLEEHSRTQADLSEITVQSVARLCSHETPHASQMGKMRKPLNVVRLFVSS